MMGVQSARMGGRGVDILTCSWGLGMSVERDCV